MNWTLLTLSITPISIIAAVISGNESPVLDYGGLGLAAIVVIFLCRYVWKQNESLEKKDAVIIEMVKAGVTSQNRLSEALETRPCLKDDPRIRPAV